MEIVIGLCSLGLIIAIIGSAVSICMAINNLTKAVNYFRDDFKNK